MPVFNIASTFSRKASTDYGPLIDQVSILEKSLVMDDGTLSSGDHDVIINELNGLLAKYPFTPAQKSNIKVKIADHEKSKADIKFDSYSLDNINKNYKDNVAVFARNSGNNVLQFLEGKKLSLEDKFAALNARVENIYANQSEEEANRNSHALRNEIQNVNRELSNIYSAFDAVENPKGQIEEGLGVFITTDRNGQIIDIDIGSPENRSGFGKTGDPLIVSKNVLGDEISPVITGLQIYGNEQEGIGQDKIIKIGNARYTKDKLSLSILGDTPTYAREASATGENPQGLDLSAVSIKQNIVPGEWVEGINSKNLYQMKSDGTYRKYVGSTAEQRKNELKSIGGYALPVNRIDEKMYNNLSNETLSNMTLAPLNFQPSYAPSGAQSAVSSQSPVSQTAQNIVQPAVASPAGPTTRVPQETKGIARKTLESAVSYFGSFFGK